MKLAVDTNVLISGALWHGAPARLLDAVFRGRARLFLSPALLDELMEVLRRRRFSAPLERAGQTPASILERMRAASHVVQPAVVAAPARLRDSGDIIVLACAVAAGADAIVTGDDDLLALKSFNGIPILRPPEALALLGVD